MKQIASHILYKITYLPHIKNNTLPYYYIGSKYNYIGNYYGSLSSKQKDWYTNNKTIKDWWNYEIKNNPHNFTFEILQTFENITPKLLVEYEHNLHQELNVAKNKEYFNMSIATLGFCSGSKTELSKQIIALKTKQYWDSPKGQLKKERLKEFNKLHHKGKIITDQHKKQISEKMKGRIISKKTKKLMSVAMKSRQLELKKLGKSSKMPKKVRWNNLEFASAKKAASELNKSPGHIRLLCFKNKNGWSYIDG